MTHLRAGKGIGGGGGGKCFLEVRKSRKDVRDDDVDDDGMDQAYINCGVEKPG